ncbi:MAG: 50S ribosomal protein L29 [Candidatus Aminicenantes bacterium RBG_16_63_16]|nr:MAG: 50S ribosomal protein L29 [Candidatus Aminicenantes bacterium RBG_16_63_16]
MKPQELKELSDDELRTKEKELGDQLFKLRFQHTLGQLENPMKLRNIRREIARIKTVLDEKRRGKE